MKNFLTVTRMFLFPCFLHTIFFLFETTSIKRSKGKKSLFYGHALIRKELYILTTCSTGREGERRRLHWSSSSPLAGDDDDDMMMHAHELSVARAVLPSPLSFLTHCSLLCLLSAYSPAPVLFFLIPTIINNTCFFQALLWSEWPLFHHP